MRAAPIVALAFALLIAGCSGVKPAAPAAQPPTAAEAVAPTVSPAPVVPGPPNTPVVTPSATATPEPTNPAVAAPPVAPSQSAAKPIPPVAKAPSAVAPKAPVEPLPKKESPAPDVAKKAPPTLDLKSLEQQLKDTKAIGVLTKIALKNQVDDLLDKFRAFYQGKLKTTLAELRQPYDLLVLKVLSLLQDGDPPLASSIAASREAIWSILADPKKFATI